jgi:hypothetical protein
MTKIEKYNFEDWGIINNLMFNNNPEVAQLAKLLKKVMLNQSILIEERENIE